MINENTLGKIVTDRDNNQIGPTSEEADLDIGLGKPNWWIAQRYNNGN